MMKWKLRKTLEPLPCHAPSVFNMFGNRTLGIGRTTPLIEAIRSRVAVVVSHVISNVHNGVIRLCRNCCTVVSERTNNHECETIHAFRVVKIVLHLILRHPIAARNAELEN